MVTNLDSVPAAKVKPKNDLRQSQKPNSFRKGSRFVWLRITCLLASDTIAITSAWIISQALLTSNFEPGNLAIPLREVLPILGATYSIFSSAGFYQSGHHRRDYLGLIKAVSLAMVLSLGLLSAFPIASWPMTYQFFSGFSLLSLLLICLGRFVVDIITKAVRKLGIGIYPVFLIADTDKLASATAAIKAAGHYCIIGTDGAQALDLRERDATFEKLHQRGAIEVFLDWKAIENRLFLCNRFQAEGFTVRILPSEELPPPSTIFYSEVGGKLCLSCTPAIFSGLEFWTKRVFDIFIASITVILASPIYLLIALLIYLDSPGPIFYKQTRIGLKNEPFQVWKFRTMVLNADKLQKELEAKNETKDGVLFKIKDDPRITRVGKYLRQYSLDEIPQLFNVIRGEMSLVGPRPLPLRDVEKFDRHHHIRQEVLPGITGLWQISGRSDIVDFEEAYQLDLTYITSWSIWLDLQILFKTIGVVLAKSGAY